MRSQSTYLSPTQGPRDARLLFYWRTSSDWREMRGGEEGDQRSDEESQPLMKNVTSGSAGPLYCNNS